MNSLSWFLYLASIVGNIQPALALFGTIGCFVLAVIIGIATSIQNDDIKTEYYGYDKTTAAERQKLLKENRIKTIQQWKQIAVISFICIILSTLIPSRETMYLIAASEVGETVITTPQTQETIKLLNEALQAQIKELVTP